MGLGDIPALAVGTSPLWGSGDGLPGAGVGVSRKGRGTSPMLAVQMVNVELRAGRELHARHPWSRRDPLLSRALRGSCTASTRAEGCQMHQTRPSLALTEPNLPATREAAAVGGQPRGAQTRAGLQPPPCDEAGS